MNLNGILLVAGQEAVKQQTEPWYGMIPWLVLFALMYFFYLRPNLKQQKEQRNMLSNLKAGDKIITNGGIWGDIDSIDDQRIRLKVADKVKITISRNCVHALQSKVTETDKKS